MKELREADSIAFESEMNSLQEEKKKLDREIRNVESTLDGHKNKVAKTARDSATGEPLNPEIMLKLNKKQAEKENELRKLRLANIRIQEKLRKFEIEKKIKKTDSKSLKR
ncbi:uncharacterized protein LOC111715117 [Eurytemora carolleeae]|uniref:uncharacterized protein LOC111715117 n=1 Tax=Eurytemora carolleeae TaxID=1294199 RepID=UPI000C772021|nr:uncharacterized protein LOC111715117 [Eurytemora carolleeae]|eukprot:XP_023346147.1 uncharacterized protein LOC111715117 [Eurytemora affinis]